MQRGARKIKNNKHNDRIDAFAFAYSLFGEPFGHVDAIKISEEGVTAKVTMKKEQPKPQLWLPLDSAEICYTGDGKAVAAVFDADDEALIPFGLKLSQQKHRPSTYQRILYQQEKFEEKRKEAFSWWDIKKANPGLMDMPSPVIINIEELKEIQCNVCKAKMQPNAELHYVVKSRGLVSLFSGETEETLHDAYDCPLCGSQIILGPRLEKLK